MSVEMAQLSVSVALIGRIPGSSLALDLEWRVADPTLGIVDASGLFTATTSVPPAHSRRTTVVAGGLYNGRLYWDFATVRVVER